MEIQEHEHIGINVNETNNLNSGEEILKQTEIEGTPFKMVEMGEQGRITLGQYGITDIMPLEKAKEKAKELQAHDWKIMCAVIGAITNQTIMTFKNEI